MAASLYPSVPPSLLHGNSTTFPWMPGSNHPLSAANLRFSLTAVKSLQDDDIVDSSRGGGAEWVELGCGHIMHNGGGAKWVELGWEEREREVW